MPDSPTLSHSLARLRLRLDRMPPVQAMELRVDSYEPGRGLSLCAPLAANVNDKQCAFGGSLASVMTLACWGSASIVLDLAGFPDAEVYVQDSRVRYLAPLYDDLCASAQLDGAGSWDGFVQAYRSKGKARATLCAEIRTADGRLAASFAGRFVALRPAAG